MRCPRNVVLGFVLLFGCSGSGIEEDEGQAVDVTFAGDALATTDPLRDSQVSSGVPEVSARDTEIAPPVATDADQPGRADTGERGSSDGTPGAELGDGEAGDVSVGPAPGEAGSPCEDNVDCFSGYCIPSSSGYVCADYCSETCPEGLECRLLSLPGADPTYICVDPFVHLCQPCTAHSDCQVHSGDTAARCIDRGVELGSFCGVSCDDESLCPEGYTCEPLEGEASQCQPSDAECTCSPWAVEVAATTACSLGVCSGQRTCTADGLSACDAPVADDESCNGVDDDCDGLADEGFAVDGIYAHPEHCGACGESCAGTIDHAEATCGVIDGLPTCVVASCEPGYIQVDATSCAIDVASQCVPCDGTSPCASSALGCESLGSASFCVASCEQDSDCAPDFVCTSVSDGAAFCLLPTGGCASEGTECLTDATCEDLNPCTEGSCDLDACTFAATDCDDGESCTTDACDPGVGCTHTPVADATPCDDGSACTEADFCLNGACTWGLVVDCDDGLLCTEDECEEGPDGEALCVNSASVGTCVVDAACTFDGQMNPVNPCEVCDALASPYDWSPQTNGVPCDDGAYCTVDDACLEGVCSAGAARDCSSLDNGGCQIGICDEAGETCALGAAEDGTACDSDGDGCTEGDQCAAGACEPGEMVICEDTLSCTTDLCVSEGPDTHSCSHAVSEGACLIGGTCYTALSDHPDDVCLGCFPEVDATTWTPQANGLACDDGVGCTYEDVCTEGVCAGTESDVCSVGEEESVACGFCGSQSRSCNEGCQWGPFGACVGEGVCAEGDSEEETQPCGQCGLSTRVRTCGEGCAWSAWSEWGACVESGACAPGEVESESSACGNCGSQERSRTCSESCQWGAWGDYGACAGEGSCSPGAEEDESQSLSCGNCGVQAQLRSRVCNDACEWGSYGEWSDVGTCSEQGVCAPGAEDSETQVAACGACGSQEQTRTRTCTDACGWGEFGDWLNVSACTGEGVCTPGQEQEDTQTLSCGNCGTQEQRRTRTCSDACGWGVYGSWQNVGSCSGEGVCFPGQQDSQGCGFCGGSQSRSCGGNCQWGAFGGCSDPCPSTQTIYRFYTLDDPASDNHYYSSGANPLGYSSEGAVFSLYTSSAAGLIALYQLYDGSTNDHMLSQNNSEGAHTLDSVLGYCALPAGPLGTTPLTRLYSPTSGNHFATTNPAEVSSAEANGYVAEGVLCYVP